jgi:hypothetical protein
MQTFKSATKHYKQEQQGGVVPYILVLQRAYEEGKE